MGLAEVKEELKKQIEEAEKAEQEEVVETPVEEKPEEKQPEEKPAVEVEAKPEKTNADYARERRERLKEKRENEELQAARARIRELEQLVTKPKEEPQAREEPAPNRQDDPAAYAEWEAKEAKKAAKEAAEIAKQATEKLDKQEREQRQQALRNQAQEELISFEDEFKKVATDYDDVKNYYVNTLAFSIKQLNPRITNKALAEAVTNQIMIRASQLMNDGYDNPVEALYQEIKSNGYRPKPVEAEEKKPDLARVANNRARNAGTASAAVGTGRGELTKAAAADLSVAEWAKLPKHERERLMRSM